VHWQANTNEAALEKSYILVSVSNVKIPAIEGQIIYPTFHLKFE